MRITNEQRRNNVVTAWGALQAPGWRFDRATFRSRWLRFVCMLWSVDPQFLSAFLGMWSCDSAARIRTAPAWRVHIFGRSTLSDNVPRSMAFWDGFPEERWG